MAENKLTSAVGIVVLIFIVVFFAFLISEFGVSLSNNPNAELSENSLTYIADLTGEDKRLGFDVSLINPSEVDDPLANETEENKYDFALDFVFGKKKANVFSRFAYIILSVPEFLIVDLFGFAKNDWAWLVNILDWLWRLFIFFAILWLIRNR